MEPDVTTPQPSEQAPIETLPSKPLWKSKFLWGFVGISFLAAFLVGGIAIGRHQASQSSPQTPTPANTSPSCTPRPPCLDNPNSMCDPKEPAGGWCPSETTTIPTNQKIQQSNGASLKNIKYTLPSDWTANIHDTGLVLVSSGSYSGYISIQSYEYNGSGRREFYCKISNECTDKTTFKPVGIGNITGYQVADTKNGGGSLSEYFGAKGATFYTISIFNPPRSNNSFYDSYQLVLHSLVF